MEFTGERFVPQLKGTIELEHVHRYVYSLPYIQNLDVLDIACGEGYGSALLAQHARSVTGVDIDQSSIIHAKKDYGNTKNLDFKHGSLTDIPLKDASVDVITCFESIEHITEQNQAMVELKRVLKPSGLLLLSTPNRHVYSDLTGFVNPFHPKELYRNDLDVLLEKHFKVHFTIGQRVSLSSLILSDQPENQTTTWLRNPRHTLANFTQAATYFFSFASDSDIPKVRNSIYEGYTTLDELLFERGNLISRQSALRFLIHNTRILKITLVPLHRFLKKVRSRLK